MRGRAERGKERERERERAPLNALPPTNQRPLFLSFSLTRCIALLVLLVAGAGVAALALRIKYGGLSPGSARAAAGGRRLLWAGGGGGGGWGGE